MKREDKIAEAFWTGACLGVLLSMVLFFIIVS